MPIISKVEGRSVGGKLLYAAIILVLTLGGATMVYPFLIMISGTLRSEMDEKQLDLMPRYLVDREVLYRKFLETKYNQNVEFLNRAHGRASFSFVIAELPPPVNSAQSEDLRIFLTERHPPRHWATLGATAGIKTIPENLRELTVRLRRRYGGDLDRFGRDIGATVAAWDLRALRPPEWVSNRYDFEDNPIYEELFQLDSERDVAEKQWVSISGYFIETMLVPLYGRRNVDAYNKAHVNPVETLDRFVLPRRVPGEEEPALRHEWIEYVSRELNPSFIMLEGVPDELYQAFLRERYGDAAALSRAWGVPVENLEQIQLPRDIWLSGARRVDYADFLHDQPVEHYLLTGPEFAWRDWLEQKYQTIEAVNAAHGTQLAGFDEAWLPVDQLEWRYVNDHPGSLRLAFATRNFINVFDALFVQGRAFINTTIFCILAITMALLVNPLAAYAMSRFKLPGTYKVLLVLMATMSFPPMVAMIPTFIMLRELNMLNTFWALVLPGIANGYMIFLLKGFFDSLPQDLYDAALIDGSGEIRMFFQITMALSKPILAVLALGAFSSAYMMFLYALIVCPAEEMWLLSVWLFQYQTQVSMGGMFAAVLVAAVPPLVIFIFAQNIIMRGIVVPQEK